MEINFAIPKRRRPNWLFYLPILVGLLSFSEFNYQSKIDERIPVQTELRMCSPKSQAAFSFNKIGGHVKSSSHYKHLRFTNSLLCSASAVRVQFSRCSQRFGIKIQSRVLAMVYTARNTGDIILPRI